MEATGRDELQESLLHQEAEVDGKAAEEGRLLLREHNGRRIDLPERRRPSMLIPIGDQHA